MWDDDGLLAEWKLHHIRPVVSGFLSTSPSMAGRLFHSQNDERFSDGTKPANMYNSRKPTSQKPGAQKGHKGSGLSKAVVKDKIRKADI